MLQGPDTDPDCVRFMSERIRSGLGFDREVLNYNSSGEPYWVNLEVTPIKDDAGELTHFIGVQHDVTRHKLAKAEIESHERLSDELRKSQAFLQSALDSLSAHIAILDENGTIISVNQAWRDFGAGSSNGEVIETIGVNYLEVCERSSRSPDAPEAALMARDHGGAAEEAKELLPSVPLPRPVGRAVVPGAGRPVQRWRRGPARDLAREHHRGEDRRAPAA
ncbi:MAG: PAS domain-containing protein [Phycisphaerales bacterium]